MWKRQTGFYERETKIDTSKRNKCQLIKNIVDIFHTCI